MRLLPARAAVAVLLALLCPPAGAEAPPFRLPPGYRVVSHERLAPGVEHVRLQSDRPQHVVEIGFLRKGAKYRTEVRHAGPRSQGSDRQLDGTSEMCGSCAYGTNGDYAQRQPGGMVGRPIGGVVERGIVLVSPSNAHQQASYTYGGGFTTQRLGWSARVTRGDQVLPVTGKNVPRGIGQLVLYTSDYVASTGTNPHGAELTLRLPDRAQNLAPNAPVTATLLSFGYARGNSPVQPGTAVLSGHHAGAEALRRLWESGGRGTTVELAETLSPPDVWASVGGGHILMRNGRRWLQPEAAPHLTATHPRTFAGVTTGGDLFQATVDGRARNAGRSTGMPLEEALRFFTALGAREVINMDGGGSTTFVRRGQVVNRPSDGQERPVTTAIVVLPGPLPRQPVRTPASPPRSPDPVADRILLVAGAPPAGPPVAWPVWVAAGNIGALLTAGATVWVRRDRPAPGTWDR